MELGPPMDMVMLTDWFCSLQHMVTSKWDPSQTPGDHVAQIPNLIMYTLNAAQTEQTASP